MCYERTDKCMLDNLDQVLITKRMPKKTIRDERKTRTMYARIANHSIFHNQRLHIPNAVCIFTDHTVCGEETHAGYAGDRFDEPFISIFERLVHHLLRCDVRVEII